MSSQIMLNQTHCRIYWHGFLSFQSDMYPQFSTKPGAGTQHHFPCRDSLCRLYLKRLKFPKSLPGFYGWKLKKNLNSFIQNQTGFALEGKCQNAQTPPGPMVRATTHQLLYLLAASWSATAFFGGKFSCPSKAGPSGSTPGSTWNASEISELRDSQEHQGRHSTGHST